MGQTGAGWGRGAHTTQMPHTHTHTHTHTQHKLDHTPTLSSRPAPDIHNTHSTHMSTCMRWREHGTDGGGVGKRRTHTHHTNAVTAHTHTTHTGPHPHPVLPPHTRHTQHTQYTYAHGMRWREHGTDGGGVGKRRTHHTNATHTHTHTHTHTTQTGPHPHPELPPRTRHT